jgi:hypothetical protein
LALYHTTCTLRIECYSQREGFDSIFPKRGTNFKLQVHGPNGRGLEQILKALPFSTLHTLEVTSQLANTEFDFLGGLPSIYAVSLDQTGVSRFTRYLKSNPATSATDDTGVEKRNPEAEAEVRFRSLKSINISRTSFGRRVIPGILQDLLDMLMIRYELGVEIETVRIRDAYDLDERSVEKIAEVCADVDWDGVVDMVDDDHEEYYGWSLEDNYESEESEFSF